MFSIVGRALWRDTGGGRSFPSRLLQHVAPAAPKARLVLVSCSARAFTVPQPPQHRCFCSARLLSCVLAGAASRYRLLPLASLLWWLCTLVPLLNHFSVTCFPWHPRGWIPVSSTHATSLTVNSLPCSERSGPRSQPWGGRLSLGHCVSTLGIWLLRISAILTFFRVLFTSFFF